MITLPLTTGKELTLKTSWQDFTLAEYIAVLDNDDRMSLILAACGLTWQEFEAMDVSVREIVFQSLDYLNTPLACIAEPLPFEDIGEESVGQLEDCKAVIRQHKGYGGSHLVYAIYMQKARDGFYDEKRAEKMAMETLVRPVTEVWNIISFFFYRLRHLIRNIRYWQPILLSRSN